MKFRATVAEQCSSTAANFERRLTCYDEQSVHRTTILWVADPVLRPFAALGTDGFGRSDTREALRQLHRIDAPAVAYCVLAELVKLGEKDRSVLGEAIERYGLEFSKVPFFGQPGGSSDDVRR